MSSQKVPLLHLSTPLPPPPPSIPPRQRPLRALTCFIVALSLVASFAATFLGGWRGEESTLVAFCGGFPLTVVPRAWLSVEKRAERILRESPLIDGHDDLLVVIRLLYQNDINNSTFRKKFERGGMEMHVDLPRLRAGLSGGAFWSAFMPCPLNTTDFTSEAYYPVVRATLEALDTFRRLSAKYPHYFTLSGTARDAERAFARGRLISPLAIEGLHQIGNSAATLRLYHALGVRYATLTWNCHNAYADAALISEGAGLGETRAAEPLHGGLSPAGRDMVTEMNRLGMLVDLAHVSADTMRDALVGRRLAPSSPGEPPRYAPSDPWRGSRAPPIFSHSSAFALCPHPRNVPDDVLDLVRERRGLVMVNASPGFVSCRFPEEDEEAGGRSSTRGLPEHYPPNNTLAQLVRHVTHIGRRIGYAHVGVGTDFDGMGATPRGFGGVDAFPALVAEMLRQGVDDADAARVVGGNLLRVWAEADRVAAEMEAEGALPLYDGVDGGWWEETKL